MFYQCTCFNLQVSIKCRIIKCRACVKPGNVDQASTCYKSVCARRSLRKLTNSFQQPASIMLSARILIFAFSISSHILLSAAQANSTCPLPDNAISGKHAALRGSNSKPFSSDSKSARLEIYTSYCEATSSSNYTTLGCSEENLNKSVDLERGKEVDVKYNVNGYAVLAMFIGTEVCISYRYKEITTRTAVSTEWKCESECFWDMRYETYFKNITCSKNKCDTRAEKKLKFVLHVSSGSRFAATIGVILGCVLTTAAVLF